MRGLVRLALGAMLASSVLLGAPTFAAADGCPNEQLRKENNSLGLPDCRAYEQVSPPEKSGQIVGYPAILYQPGEGAVNTVSEDGEKALFETLAPFPGSSGGLPQDEEATRGTTGWTSKSFSAAPGLAHPWLSDKPVLADVTPDFSIGIADTEDAFDPLDQDGNSVSTRFDVYAIHASGEVEWVSRPDADTADAEPVNASYVGRSKDGSHLLFQTSEKLVPADGPQVAGEALYDRVGSHTVLVGVNSGGALQSDCGSVLGTAGESSGHTVHAVSDDGSRIYFTSPTPFPFVGETNDPSCAQPFQVYLREGSRTIDVSRSQRSVPDPGGTQPAIFQAASSDGSRVFFTSREMLTDAASAEGGLYEYDVPSGRLSLIGPEGSEVIGETEDASDVYFTSWARLADAPEDGSTGLRVYLYQDGHLEYVTNAGGDFSAEFWKEALRISADGSHIAFVSSGQLTSYDNHGVGEVYEWDTASRRVSCPSCDPSGAAPLGAAYLSADTSGLFRPTYPVSSVFSEDDNELFFTTPDPLVAQDVNGEPDVYEWEDGAAHLISGGRGPQGSYLLGLGDGGRDVMFTTTDSLIPQDIDNGGNDLYDARVQGGFPVPATAAQPACSGEACQGAPASAPALPGAASASFDGPGEAASSPSASVVKAKPKQRAKKKSKAKKSKVKKKSKAKKASKVKKAIGKKVRKSVTAGGRTSVNHHRRSR